MPGKSCFPGQKQIKTAITEMAMTEISFLGEYSAHSSPREIRGSSSDLLCRTRYFRCRHTQNPSAASPFPQSCCLALLPGTDVCRASIRFICPYSSTCRVLLSRGNPHFCTLVQFRGSRGEKVVTSDRKQRGKGINENSAEYLCAHTKQRSHSEAVAIRCHSEPVTDVTGVRISRMKRKWNEGIRTGGNLPPVNVRFLESVPKKYAGGPIGHPPRQPVKKASQSLPPAGGKLCEAFLTR